jgi:hypothetical protein
VCTASKERAAALKANIVLTGLTTAPVQFTRVLRDVVARVSTGKCGMTGMIRGCDQPKYYQIYPEGTITAGFIPYVDVPEPPDPL